jgi:hypothetical protein
VRRKTSLGSKHANSAHRAQDVKIESLGGKLNGSPKLLRHEVSATTTVMRKGKNIFGQTALELLKLLTADPPPGV